MTELYIENQRVELGDTVIAQTYQINDVADIENRQCSFTNQFKVPATLNNMKLFDLLGVSGSTSRVPYRKLNARLVVDGLDLISHGYAQVKSYNGTYSIVLYDGAVGLKDSLVGKRLNDIIGDRYNHALSEESFTTRLGLWNNTSAPVIYSNDDRLYFETALSAFSLKEVVGYVMAKGNIIHSGLSDKISIETLICPAKGQNISSHISVSELDILNQIQLNGHIEDFPITTLDRTVIYFNDNALLLTWPSYDGVVSTGEIFTAGGGYQKRFNIDGFVTIRFTANALTVSIGSNEEWNTDGLYLELTLCNDNGSIYPIVMQKGKTITLKVDPSYYLKAKVKGKIQRSGSELKNITITCYADFYVTKTTCGNLSQADYRELMPDLSAIDFLKDIMQRYCLIFRPKRIGTGNLISDGLEIEFASLNEILKDKANAEDWSDKYNSHTEDYELSGFGQRNYIKSKEDSLSDNGWFDVDNECLSETKTLLTSLFGAAETSGEFAYSPLFEVKDSKDLEGKENGMCFFKKVEMDEPKEITYLGVLNGITLPAGTKKLEYIPIQRFIDENYDAYAAMLNNYKKIVAYIYLTPLDVYALDFFKLKYIKQLGKYYYLNKVDGYRSDKPLTKCELVEVPIV